MNTRMFGKGPIPQWVLQTARVVRYIDAEQTHWVAHYDTEEEAQAAQDRYQSGDYL